MKIKPTAKNIVDLKNKISKMTIDQIDERNKFIDDFCTSYSVMIIIEIQFLADRVLEIESSK